MSLLLLALALVAAPPLPEVLVTGRDGSGCARLAWRSGTKARAVPLPTAAGICVTDALVLRLEEPGIANVVLRVTVTDEAQARPGLFVYRLEGGRLTPRFLGSAFGGIEVCGTRRVAEGELDALGLDIQRAGIRSALRCRLRRFPLECEDEQLASGERSR